MAVPSSSSSSSSLSSYPSILSAYAFDELNRISELVSQRGSLSSFQQLRRTLGDDAAFVVMDYFIDIRTLHDQCVELKAYDADRHAAVLRALLLRSERGEFTAARVSSINSERAARLISARRVPAAQLSMQVPEIAVCATESMSELDCLSHVIHFHDIRLQNHIQFTLPFRAARANSSFGHKIDFDRDVRLLPNFQSPQHDRIEMRDGVLVRVNKPDTPLAPIPTNAVKFVMFSIMAHGYYHVWRVPSSTVQLINLRAIFDSVACMPAAFRHEHVAKDVQLLIDSGFE